MDGFSGYMQIHIAPEDQHKTTFTYPFGTFEYTHMPFGLCNAPSTFQHCMTSIFSDLLQDCMEVFMDDFTMYADSFDACLNNLSKVLTRCIETNLVLNFEKCHFMVTKGIVLGHLVSNRSIEVDKSKIGIITSLPNPASMWEVRSFLGHAGFYRRFTKNFSKPALPLSKLLQKDVEFKFDQPCIEAFQELKNRLTSVPILQAPNWDLQFELIANNELKANLEDDCLRRNGASPRVRMEGLKPENVSGTHKDLTGWIRRSLELENPGIGFGGMINLTRAGLLLLRTSQLGGIKVIGTGFGMVGLSLRRPPGSRIRGPNFPLGARLSQFKHEVGTIH
ncbi:Retrovirus-related Pol polyprotein from transposon 17.6, partial [Mucuna pruriens]